MKDGWKMYTFDGWLDDTYPFYTDVWLQKNDIKNNNLNHKTAIQILYFSDKLKKIKTVIKKFNNREDCIQRIKIYKLC